MGVPAGQKAEHIRRRFKRNPAWEPWLICAVSEGVPCEQKRKRGGSSVSCEAILTYARSPRGLKASERRVCASSNARGQRRSRSALEHSPCFVRGISGGGHRSRESLRGEAAFESLEGSLERSTFPGSLLWDPPSGGQRTKNSATLEGHGGPNGIPCEDSARQCNVSGRVTMRPTQQQYRGTVISVPHVWFDLIRCV